MTSNSNGTENGTTGPRLPWPVVTLSLASLAVAAVGALVFVVALKGAELLSTVALALAILSFTAQLIFTAAQTHTANEQYRQMNRLYEESRSVLKKIRTQSDALLTNQRDQFNKVLDYVLSPSAIQNAVGVTTSDEHEGEDGRTAATSEDGPPEPAQPTPEEISRRLREAANEALEKRYVPSQTEGALSPKIMQRFPSEDDVARVAPIWASLSEEAKSVIRSEAASILKNPRVELQRKILVRRPVSELPDSWKELAKTGFIELTPGRHQGRDTTYRTLLPHAVTALRFFTGNGPVPPYLRSVLADGKQGA